MATALDRLNSLDRAAFVAALGSVFEHSPWVAERTWETRPFASVDALHAAMMSAVRTAPHAERIALLTAHPELAGREARAGSLTGDSTTEQGRLGFDALGGEELARVSESNRRYREKFGFPCIVALALHANRESVHAEMKARLANDADAEIANALRQVAAITRARLGARLARFPA